jgi:hypothetical protein
VGPVGHSVRFQASFVAHFLATAEVVESYYALLTGDLSDLR